MKSINLTLRKINPLNWNSIRNQILKKKTAMTIFLGYSVVTKQFLNRIQLSIWHQHHTQNKVVEKNHNFLSVKLWSRKICGHLNFDTLRIVFILRLLSESGYRSELWVLLENRIYAMIRWRKCFDLGRRVESNQCDKLWRHLAHFFYYPLNILLLYLISCI